MWPELMMLGKGLLIWTGVHYAAVHGYQWLCVPTSWWGLATAPVRVAAPHCRILVWLVDVSSLSVVGVWTAGGLLLSSKIFDLLPAVAGLQGAALSVWPARGEG